MNVSPRLLVTGASGNVGRHVVRALEGLDVRVRAAGRHPQGLNTGFGAEVEWVALDVTDPVTWPDAVAGVNGMFLMRPPAVANVEDTINPLIDAAIAAGVTRFVLLSVAGADRLRFLPHARIEKHLMKCGAGWTFLRAGFFAQNLGDAYRRDICEDERIHVPAGGGKVAFVDTRDIAELAATILVEPEGHLGRAYHLTGPEALDFHTIAARLSQVVGRPVRYDPAGALEYARHLRRQGLPWSQAMVQTMLHVGLRFGQAEMVAPFPLDRPRRHLDDYLRDHADLWQVSSVRDASGSVDGAEEGGDGLGEK